MVTLLLLDIIFFFKFSNVCCVMFFILNFVSTADIILILSRQYRNYLLTSLHIHGDTLKKYLNHFQKRGKQQCNKYLKNVTAR